MEPMTNLICLALVFNGLGWAITAYEAFHEGETMESVLGRCLLSAGNFFLFLYVVTSK